MNSKYIFAILTLVLLTSCEFVQRKFCGMQKGVVLDTVVDYESVDTFPSFSACDSLVDTTLKNRCFTHNLYQHLSTSLLAHTFTVYESIDEKVGVKLKIDAEGSTTLVSITSSDTVKKALPQLDSLIAESVQTLPKVFPALKHGIPVATVYEVPLVLKID